jgi:hypothetical protein
MSMQRTPSIRTMLLSGAVTAAVAFASPALARGGGHHHGECGEHHGGDRCSYSDHEFGHHGGRGHSEGYHDGNQQDARDLSDGNGPRAPLPPLDPPQTDQP